MASGVTVNLNGTHKRTYRIGSNMQTELVLQRIGSTALSSTDITLTVTVYIRSRPTYLSLQMKSHKEISSTCRSSRNSSTVVTVL